MTPAIAPRLASNSSAVWRVGSALSFSIRFTMLPGTWARPIKRSTAIGGAVAILSVVTIPGSDANVDAPMLRS